MTRRDEMKQSLLIGLLCGTFAMNVSAGEYVDDGFWFPNESFHDEIKSIVPAEQLALNDGAANDSVVGDGLIVAENSVNNAMRLKFMSRRGYQNPAVKNKEPNKLNDEWVGATYVDEKEAKASKRLNRQFRSKRPHIDYQFD